jgi:hypothetical protein
MDGWMVPLLAIAASDDRANAGEVAEAMLVSSRRVPETGRVVFAIARAQEQRADARAREQADNDLSEQFAKLLVDNVPRANLPLVLAMIQRLPEKRRKAVELTLDKLPGGAR